MNHARSMLRCAAAIVIVLVGLAGWHPRAEAFDFNTLISILQKMDEYNVNPFPVKAGEIKAVEKIAKELAGGANVLKVIQENQDDPMIAKYGGELPPWFDNVVEALIAVQDNDFFGVVKPLGEAAVCVIAQVMAAGIDLCGLIESLIAVGEALLDAATAVGKFFADLGGGIYDGVSCGIFGSCGSGPPPEQTTYNCVFAPQVKPKGLAAMEAVDQFAFGALRDSLIAAAKKGTQCPVNSFPPYYQAEPGPAQKAADIYTNAVEGVWSAHIQTDVLLARDKQRIAYNTPAQIKKLADAATAAYQAKKGFPKNVVVDTCAIQDFGVTFGFAHVDRWLNWRQAGNTEVQKKAMALANVTSNRSWCETEFWGKNLEKFAAHFRTYAQANYCPLFGQQLTCTTIEKYQACTGLMGSVNQAEQCAANAASLGGEIAKKIGTAFKSGSGAAFKSAPSTHPCKIVLPDGGAPMSNKPVEFLCTRPTQQHFCEKEYQALWTGKAKVLTCATPPAMIPPAYAAQMQKVQQAVTALQAKYPTLGVDKFDPLLVRTGSFDAYNELKATAGDAKNVRQVADGVQFTYLAAAAENIDGVGRPTMVPSALFVKQDLPVVKPSLKENLVKPGDPDPLAQPAAGSLKQSSPATMVPAGAAALGAAALGAQGPGVSGAAVPTTSGPAPSDSGPRGALQGERGRLIQAPASRTAPARMGLPPTQLQPSLPAVQQPMMPPARQAAPAVRPPPALPTRQQPGSPRAIAPLMTPGGSPDPAEAAATARGLAAAGCARAPGAPPTALSFACTSRAGFERCEALRAQRKLDQCALNAR